MTRHFRSVARTVHQQAHGTLLPAGGALERAHERERGAVVEVVVREREHAELARHEARERAAGRERAGRKRRRRAAAAPLVGVGGPTLPAASRSPRSDEELGHSSG